jgi:hypothetical protein
MLGNIKIKTNNMKKTSIWLSVGVVCMVLVSSYTGYAYWDKYRAEANLNTVETSLSSYRAEMLQAENQHVLQAISAKNIVEDVRKDIVVWSEVIDNIRGVVPVSEGKSLIDILSYSGSVNSDISMSVKTVPGSENPYFDVADIIEKFSSEKEFEDVFVSAISRATDTEGNEILSFPMRFKYLAKSNSSVVEEEEDESSTISR